jgi:hypothetical protein
VTQVAKKPAESSGTGPWPRLMTFWVVLPEPLPFEHGTTYTFAHDERIPELEGVVMAPVAEVKPFENQEGQTFVSFRIWQVNAKSLTDQQAVEALVKVAQAVSPADRAPKSPRDVPDDEAVTKTVTTVVEMVAPRTAPAEKPLERCLDDLVTLARAVRISERTGFPEVTRERIWPLVLWAEREFGPEGGWLSGPALFPIHPMMRVIPPPDPLAGERLERFNEPLDDRVSGPDGRVRGRAVLDPGSRFSRAGQRPVGAHGSSPQHHGRHLHAQQHVRARRLERRTR